MGRRKIEIQPITHERNRAVTFLKRKNGLFKKAYELGVLCSVDVAVIIFEERPGHHVKLYQYCSSDIHDMVQRHLRHDGEKDTRGPADFSGNVGPKVEDAGDDNDEDGDDDDDMPRNKRGRDGKPKPGPDMHVAGMEYGHRNVPIPPSLPIHGIGGQGGGQGLPISNVSNVRDTKRTRLGLHPPHSRSPSDDPTNGGYHYPTHNSAGAFGAARHGAAGYHPSQTQHHQSGTQYPFLPPSNSPTSFDLPQGGIGLPPRGQGQGYGLPARTGSSGSGAYEGTYGNMMGRGGIGIQGSGHSAGGENLFPGLQQNTFPGIDWPVHAGANPGTNGSTPLSTTVPPPAPSQPSAASDTTSQNSNGNWLDFLSGNNQSGTQGREAMSWERGGGPPGSNPDLYADRGRTGGGGSPMVGAVAGNGKRSPGGGSTGLLSSPLGTVNGRDDTSKEIGAT